MKYPALPNLQGMDITVLWARVMAATVILFEINTDGTRYGRDILY
jgi:hypothetical protein